MDQLYKKLGTGRGFWKPGRNVSWAITAICEVSFILFGSEQGIIGNLVTGDNFLETFGHPTGSYLGIIVSIFTLGCFFGCVMNYYIGDMLGRRLILILAMVLVIIGVALQACAYSVVHLMIARFICGLGTELSRPEVRGNLVCSEPLFVGIGLVYAYWLTYGLSFASGSIAWRLPLASQIVFALFVLIFIFTVPESPRYLYMKGDKEEAKQTLCYVFGKDSDDPEIIRLYQEIEEAMELETLEGEYTWKKLFKSDTAKTRHRIILSYMSMFAQQMGVLIENVGLERNLAMILAGCSVICFTIGSLVPSFFADSLGRRKPLVWGHAGGSFSMLMIAILLIFQNNESISKQTGAAAVGFFFVFQLVFGASSNCIPWVLVPELLPLHARSKGTAIGISANWLWNFFVVEITPEIITNIKWRSYLIFAATNFAFSIMFYLFYPETQRLTLEAIDRVFVQKNRLFMGFVDTKEFMYYEPELPLSPRVSFTSKQEAHYIEHVESSSISGEASDQHVKSSTRKSNV
ncbi:Hexose transporter 2 [Wickerhamomyces ciferrii]|uniref:Hexose transporter 2 n=1 Tax=Wickerhamomyces ciferrii (strain ATCC 14091 / BCRC 22168 / CBS 111 / JCM 3599 / NBRC 0793 / NRRL Y-1031 F-60-10) TaxID=1206466 RepID=K0KRI0_WICCF|nr:Hexose transporter 2 [Wickerhamomyces ciferrii]CCH43899.1 Hexose transporter 2 [Wickerhamomyces ciferrii]